MCGRLSDGKILSRANGKIDAYSSGLGYTFSRTGRINGNVGKASSDVVSQRGSARL